MQSVERKSQEPLSQQDTFSAECASFSEGKTQDNPRKGYHCSEDLVCTFLMEEARTSVFVY